MAKRKKKHSPPSLYLVAATESHQRQLIDEQAGKELKALIQLLNQANAQHKASKASQQAPEYRPPLDIAP